MRKPTRRQLAALLIAAVFFGVMGMGALADDDRSAGQSEQALDVYRDTSPKADANSSGATEGDTSGESDDSSGNPAENTGDSSTKTGDGSGQAGDTSGDASDETGDPSGDGAQTPADGAQSDGSGSPDSSAESGDGSSSSGVPATPGETPELPVEDPNARDLLPGATIGDPPLDGEAGNPLPNLPGLDKVGSISFPNIRSRIREHNLDYLSLEGSILTIEEIDYDETYEDLREAMNSLASTQWMMVQYSSMMGGADYETGSAMAAMDQQYAALREQFEAIKDGEMQQDNADLVRQLRNLQNQIVLGGETMYIALVDLQENSKTLDRNLVTLDRTITELELRYKLGQISAMTLQETKGNRTSIVSGQKTLDMNIKNLKYQLESMLGAELKGTIELAELPQVTGEQLNAMDLEKDLETAKKNSYDLFDAAKTYEDAHDTYKDQANNYGYNEERAEFRRAQREWQSAQNSYQNTVQSFELNFRTLYEQVKDYKQVLDASRTALAVKKANYEASALKYQQGNISKNTLLSSQDEVDTAQETVNGALIDLFSAYNTYRWAVDYGILNG